jgi:fumarate reductase subunit D
MIFMVAIGISAVILICLLAFIYFVVSDDSNEERKKAFWKTFIYPCLIIVLVAIGMFVSYVHYAPNCLGEIPASSCKDSYWGERSFGGFGFVELFINNN